MNSFETEDRTNPFSQYDNSDSKASDFKVNQFSSEQAPHKNEFYAGQAPFPQFGNIPIQDNDNIRDRIEAAKSDGWGAKISEFANSRKKKFLIFAVIALLFIGGSYLKDTNDAQNVPPSGNADSSKSIVNQSYDENAATSNEDEGNVPLNVLDIKINEDGEVIFSGEESADNQDSITKTASYGDGITHLARSAIYDYLAESGKSLSAEQKIYAEDYVQNRIGSELLEIDQKISFSKGLLKEAVEKSEMLEQWQVENLKQYSSTVSLL